MQTIGWRMRWWQWRLKRAVLKCVADRPETSFGIDFGLGWGSYSPTGPYLLADEAAREQFLKTAPDDLEFRNPDFELADGSSNPNFLALLSGLQKSSLREPRGPIDGVRVVVHARKCTLRYTWVQDHIDEFHATERQSGDGIIPSFVILSDFSDRVVTRIRAAEVYSAMLTIGSLVGRDAEHYPAPLVEAVAVVDWLADTRNGALEQYFARRKLSRTNTYGRVLAGLQRIKHDAGAALFREAVAIYSHFDPEIDRARQQLDIDSVPRVEESDIMHRFYQMHKEVESAMGEYFVAHAREFSVPEWRRKWYKL